MLEDAFFDKPLQIMIRMSSVGMVADGEIELFARELLGKGGANEEEDFLHVTCI